MKNKLYFILLVSICLMTKPAFAQDNNSYCITTAGYGAGGWLPSNDDIKNLQKLLPEKFENASKSLSKDQLYLNDIPKLSNYTLRCTGQIGKLGEQTNIKLIYIDGFCSNSHLTKDKIKNGAVMKDGGSCYFSGIYDPLKKEIISFYFNGVA